MRTFRLIAFFALLPGLTLNAQSDSTIAAQGGAGNFGIFAGMSYSHLALRSSPFLLDDREGQGDVSVINSPGFSGGLFFLIPSAGMRVAVEVNMTPAEIAFDFRRPNKEESWIYPLTVEIPVHYITPALFGKSKWSPGMLAGIRIVTPIPVISSPYPELQPVTLNLDGGIRLPLQFAKSDASLELMYSFGLFNLHNPETDHLKNQSISSIRRDFVGLRCYFN
jgi:hypothetical protein